MSSLLKRYRAGDGQVLTELCSLGERVREAPWNEDGWGVAQEVAERCYQNLSQLNRSLTDLGYRFQNPQRVLVEASSEQRRQLAALEARQGTLPLILRAWYERIECVDFRQEAAQLRGDEQSQALGVAGLGNDPVLTYLSITEALQLKANLLHEAAASGGGDPASAVDDRFFFPLGGWASNCEPKGVFIPSIGFDDVIYNDGGGDVSFLDELQLAFRWGGFPFWSFLILRPKRRRPAGPVPAFADLLPRLVSGVRPL